MMQDNTIEKIIKSWDELPRAQANPYLFSKIKNRLESQQIGTKQIWTWALGLSLIIAINCFTWANSKNESSNTSSTTVYGSINTYDY